MNQCISEKINDFCETDVFMCELEKNYQPSTFKFVKKDLNLNYISSLFGFLNVKSGINSSISLFLEEKDEIIDELSIENDLAVVSKDFLISYKKTYDNKCTKVWSR